MKSEPELKPRQVAVAAFYVEPTTPGKDRRWKKGAEAYLGPASSTAQSGAPGLPPPAAPLTQ